MSIIRTTTLAGEKEAYRYTLVLDSGLEINFPKEQLGDVISKEKPKCIEINHDYAVLVVDKPFKASGAIPVLSYDLRNKGATGGYLMTIYKDNEILEFGLGEEISIVKLKDIIDTIFNQVSTVIENHPNPNDEI